MKKHLLVDTLEVTFPMNRVDLWRWSRSTLTIPLATLAAAVARPLRYDQSVIGCWLILLIAVTSVIFYMFFLCNENILHSDPKAEVHWIKLPQKKLSAAFILISTTQQQSSKSSTSSNNSYYGNVNYLETEFVAFKHFKALKEPACFCQFAYKHRE